MKERVLKLSEINLKSLLESSIKVVENDFKLKYLATNETLNDYGFNRESLIESYIESLTKDGEDIFIPFAYKKIGLGDTIHLLDGNTIFNDNNCANIGDLTLSLTSDIGFLLSHNDGNISIKAGYATDNHTLGFKAKENIGVLKPKMESYINRFVYS